MMASLSGAANMSLSIKDPYEGNPKIASSARGKSFSGLEVFAH